MEVNSEQGLGAAASTYETAHLVDSSLSIYWHGPSSRVLWAHLGICWRCLAAIAAAPPMPGAAPQPLFVPMRPSCQYIAQPRLQRQLRLRHS